MRNAIVICVALLLLPFMPFARAESTATSKKAGAEKTAKNEQGEKRVKIVKSAREWRKQLSKKQFEVTREGATERPRTGKYWRHKQAGTYTCICCEQPLFSSQTKYASGTGWPSFFAPIDKRNIETHIDRSIFQVRTEVVCSRCDAHLGHVFSDGPRPTGLRYCLNSAALNFAPKESDSKKANSKSKRDDAEQVEERSDAKSDADVSAETDAGRDG